MFNNESILKQYAVEEDTEAYIFDNNSLTYPSVVNLTEGIIFKENTSYIISYVAKQVSGNPRLTILYTDGTYGTIMANTIATEYTQYWAVSDNTKTINYICGRYSSNGTKSFYIKKNSLYVAEGTTDVAPTYEPYSSQTKPLNLGTIELNKIGNYQDYIYKNNDKWYKKEVIPKYIFNGSEDWTKSGTADVFYLNQFASGMLKDNANIPMCNVFKGVLTVGSASAMGGKDNNTCAVGNIGDNNRIYVKTNEYSTVTALGTAMAGKVAYYIKAEPTDIEITDTDLISQLEAIQKLKQYNDTTIITIDDIKEFDILLDGSKIEKITDDIGDTSQLTTTAKTDLVSAVNEVNSAIGDIGSLLDELNGTEV